MHLDTAWDSPHTLLTMDDGATEQGGTLMYAPTQVTTGGPNLFQRINAVMRAVRSVDTSTKHSKGFNYAGHDAVTNVLRDAMVENGIMSFPTVTDVKRDGSSLTIQVSVVYVNCDNPNEKFAVSVVGESFSTSKDRTTGVPLPEAVQFGMALSYAQKCADLKVFRLVGDKTPDSEKEKDDPTPAAPEKPALTDDESKALVMMFGDCETMVHLTDIKAKASEYARTRSISPEQMQAMVKAKAAAEARVMK